MKMKNYKDMREKELGELRECETLINHLWFLAFIYKKGESKVPILHLDTENS